MNAHCTPTTPGWLRNWLERHQSRLSFWLHMVGIPLTLIAAPLAIWQLLEWRWDLWWRPVALLVGGYLLQWVGHLHEGNDMGEVVLIKKLLGRPYVAVSPRFQRPPAVGPARAADAVGAGRESAT